MLDGKNRNAKYKSQDDYSSRIREAKAMHACGNKHLAHERCKVHALAQTLARTLVPYLRIISINECHFWV